MLVHRLDFAQTLAPCLLSQNMDLVVEVARVFGNFSQSKEIRQLLVDNRGAPLAPKTRSFVGVRREGRGGDSCKCGHKLPSRMHTRARGQIAHTHTHSRVRAFHLLPLYAVDELLIVLLEHANREVVYTVCGILMNLLGDADFRPIMQKNDCAGVDSLIDVRCASTTQELCTGHLVVLLLLFLPLPSAACVCVRVFVCCCSCSCSCSCSSCYCLETHSCLCGSHGISRFSFVTTFFCLDGTHPRACVSHTCTHTYTRTHIHTHIHTHAHTYTRTHIHTHTHSLSLSLRAPFRLLVGVQMVIGSWPAWRARRCGIILSGLDTLTAATCCSANRWRISWMSSSLSHVRLFVLSFCVVCLFVCFVCVCLFVCLPVCLFVLCVLNFAQAILSCSSLPHPPVWRVC